jgi:hypothetical protein
MATASYPGVVKTYTDKTDGIDYVKAADMNSVQSEIQAIETALGATPATSSLPSAGTYNSNGVSTSVTARITNLEAGLTAGATDGSRVGYTQLATGSFASAPGAISVTTTNYQKLVVVIAITTLGSGTAISLQVNSASASKIVYTSYAGTTTGNTSAGGVALITNNAAPATNDIITAEIFNPGATGFKTISWTNGTGFGFGQFTTGATGAVTSVTISASTYPTAATYTIYGVK